MKNVVPSARRQSEAIRRMVIAAMLSAAHDHYLFDVLSKFRILLHRLSNVCKRTNGNQCDLAFFLPHFPDQKIYSVFFFYSSRHFFKA